jgi:predicted RNase H-like nuclease (RuvC/YqgF family)
MQIENPLSGLEPPTESLANWWPLIGFGLSLAVAAASASWAAWLQFKQWQHSKDEKKIDAEKEHAIQSEQRKQAVEIEELKLNFDQRQKLLESLSKQFEMQLTEGRLMRDELSKARVELQERDKTISELRTTVAEMQVRIRQLEREVAQVEKTQEQHIRAAHNAAGATQG